MSKLLEQPAIVSQVDCNASQREKPSNNNFGIKELTRLSIVKSVYQRNNEITSPQWDVLMIVIDNWENKHAGINSYNICKRLTPERDVMSIKTNTLRKCVWLLQNGFIEIVGKGKTNNNLYAPTIKVLKDIALIIQSA